MTATVQQFPITLEDRLAELAAARAQLMAEVQSGISGAAQPQPESGRWSLAEVVYHLYLSEKSISRLLQKALGSGERHTRMGEEHLRAEWERIGSTVGRRERRASAPPPAVPTNAPGLEEAVELLHQSRQTLLEMLSNVTLDDLVSVSMPHPLEVIGLLTGAGWLSLIAYHEQRHTEQIQELKQNSQSSEAAST
jgi:uncharacterized damage-inducible protein DinB